MRIQAPMLLFACVATTGAASAAVVEPTPPLLQPVQVTAIRTSTPVREVPSAITVIAGDRLAAPGLSVNLSEKLAGVPGVLARARQNYAQDIQISIRGFGARSTFGIRGVRLYLDGIPATMPDGQGQVSHFNLASVARIEVLRGPFSVLYGNASGGVIQAFTADGASDPRASLSLAAGGDAVHRVSAGLRGGSARSDYTVELTHFDTAGFRDHSRASRNSFNARLKLATPGAGKLIVLANGLDSPEAQDPLGLTAAQLDEDPRQAAAAASLFDTRKAVRHAQLGMVLEQPFDGGHALRLLGYAGSRDIVQFLSVPVAAQGNPLHGGGVVDLESRFSGLDARWTWQRTLGPHPIEFVAGISVDRQQQQRLGFNNFSGTQLGVRGDMRRDQDDFVRNADWYGQALWSFSQRGTLMLGVRRSHVRFESRDDFVTPSNPDDSGDREFTATSPVAGVSLAVGSRWNLYASFGKGFETPTFDELGYRPDGSAGLNFGLEAARSRHLEIGAKGRIASNASFELALFRADVDDELAVASNSGGRSTYQNVGHARRQGLEFAVDAPLAGRWHWRAAYTYLDARFQDPFLACAGGPCATPSVPVAAGSRIPGTAESVAMLALDWRPGTSWRLRVDGNYVGAVVVNNAGDVQARPYVAVDASGEYRLRARGADMRAFLRIGNVLDRRYAGSVIVNESNGRYFEPAPGRTLLAGVDLRW